jgi:hypothetical protein
MVYTLTHLGEAQMPWNECKPMDERLKFIARLLDGEKMAPECRSYCARFNAAGLNNCWSISTLILTRWIEPYTGTGNTDITGFKLRGCDQQQRPTALKIGQRRFSFMRRCVY